MLLSDRDIRAQIDPPGGPSPPTGTTVELAGLPVLAAEANTDLSHSRGWLPLAGLLAVGIVTFPTLTQALLAPAIYLGFATLEGHFITPSIMGQRLTLNPLTVILSLVFWAWLWGPFGAFLAVPLLIVALVTIKHLFPDDEPELPD